MGVVVIHLLFSAYTPKELLGPWVSDEWRDVTKTNYPPWMTQEEVEGLDMDYQIPMPGWTAATVLSVRKLLDAYWESPSTEKAAMRNRLGDAFVAGRKALKDYTRMVTRQWTMPVFVDRLMEDIDLNLYAYAGQNNYTVRYLILLVI